MEEEYGVGIQGGNGWWAGMHIEAYTAHPKAKIVALCGRDVEKLRARAASMGLECEIYTDYEKMLADENIDIVSICTPPSNHAKESIWAIQAGKHILIEKPIATSIEDLSLLKKTASGLRVKTMVGFVLRWNGMVRTIKAMMEGNAIGDVFMAQADFWQNVSWLDVPMNAWLGDKSIAGSSLLGGGSHAIDAIRWLTGYEVTEVYAHSINANSPGYNYDPTIVALMKFDGGALGKITSTLEPQAPYRFRIELLGTRGTICNNRFYTRDWPGQLDYAEIPLAVPGGPTVEDLMKMEVSHFIECIDSGVESHVSLSDAIKTHEALMAADLSVVEGHPIALPII